MLSMKVKIKVTNSELPSVKAKIKYNNNQPVDMTKVELASLLIAYAKTVLKDHNKREVVNHDYGSF